MYTFREIFNKNKLRGDGPRQRSRAARTTEGDNKYLKMAVDSMATEKEALQIKGRFCDYQIQEFSGKNNTEV